ncbi:MAG: PLP-dependent aminotransferase family protein [Eggerthellaceae bacterium]|nr:PLP-dependent aminotransferase family protein [Eggerthellaceae bacterium]
MPSIDKSSSEPYYLQVFSQIADGITSGLYPAGKKLPSIRKCARDLGVSNTTIEYAYQKLTAEGYISARRGSGYTVCAISDASANPMERYTPEHREAIAELMRAAHTTAKKPRYDFAYDAVDQSIFPFTTWARISREVFFVEGSEGARLYNDPQGLYALRQQIARHVADEHSIACVPEQILVMPTTRTLVAAIAGLLDARETRFVMENPGYDEVARLLRAQGFGVSPLSVEPFPSWKDAQKTLKGANVVFTTPACQFPTNRPMPSEFREQLVDWAERTGAYIIDDEYGWELQSGIIRTPPLATLDHNGRIITLGTFSNTFTPAVSLSYAVLPPRLALEWLERNRDSHPQVPWQTQAAMALFMDEGHWRAHLRKMRTAMARKCKRLLDAIDSHMGSEVDVISNPSSLFALIKTHDGRAEEDLVSSAAAVGVRVYPTDLYWFQRVPDDWRNVLVGFAGIAENDIEPGIEALSRAWGFDQ